MIEMSIASQTNFAAMDHIVMKHLVSECAFGEQFPLGFMIFKNRRHMILADFRDKKKRNMLFPFQLFIHDMVFLLILNVKKHRRNHTVSGGASGNEISIGKDGVIFVVCFYVRLAAWFDVIPVSTVQYEYLHFWNRNARL